MQNADKGRINYRIKRLSVSPQIALVGGGQTVHFQAAARNDAGLTWSVNGVPGGNPSVGMIDPQGNYTAPPSLSGIVKITVTTHQDLAKSATATAIVIPPGEVTATNNPQVALYTISPPAHANVSVQFGTDTNYGLTTWAQRTPRSRDTVGIFVAGMRAFTTYHMRAIVQFDKDLEFVDSDHVEFDKDLEFIDSDHVFTTGGLAPDRLPQITAAATLGLTPQPGVELINLVNIPNLDDSPLQVFATDLSGNTVWSYLYEGSSADLIQPVKLLPNGHFLVVITPGSFFPPPPIPPGTIDVVREIDLAGNTIREISIEDLNNRLATAGFDLVGGVFHHDVFPLPNGHWIVLVDTIKEFSDLPGYPGTIAVLGDALVDLDLSLQPVWIWNSFDHLDVNRHPMSFPDWTHSNAILYSHDDGNLLLSIRNQNWIIKIDYRHGRGDGDVIWRLGQGGDFTLQNGTDPTDWFYAQHDPSFATSRTARTFSLVMFDNGDDRSFPPGMVCGETGAPPCLYSTVPILQIDESARTAALSFHYTAPQYSGFGGNAELLSNGNIEFDECSVGSTVPNRAIVFEVTQEPSPQVVWQMDITGAFAYRAFRIPSLYPGVQW